MRVHYYNPLHWSRVNKGWGEALCGWREHRTTVTKNVTCPKCKANDRFKRIVRDADHRKRTNLGRWLVVVINRHGGDSGWIRTEWQERRPSYIKARRTLTGKMVQKDFVVGYIYDTKLKQTEDVEHQSHGRKKS